jgi:hypothetical protein
MRSPFDGFALMASHRSRHVRAASNSANNNVFTDSRIFLQEFAKTPKSLNITQISNNAKFFPSRQ